MPAKKKSPAKKATPQVFTPKVEDRHYFMIALVIIGVLALVYAYLKGLGAGIDQGMMGGL